MKVEIINETGFYEAIKGLALSYGTTIEKANEVAVKLAIKDGGHNKFLESIIVWLDVTAPRYWWQQFDTYRIGVTKQSESTMHTIMKSHLTNEHFEKPLREEHLMRLNNLIYAGMFEQLKAELPEGFLQKRIICTSYKVLRTIFSQRLNHKLKEWKKFCIDIRSQIEFPEYFRDIFEVKR